MSYSKRKTIARFTAWTGACWIGLVALAFVGMAALAVFKFVTGQPEGEGIVMLPGALIVSLLFCLPGIAILALGLFMLRRTGNPN